MQRARLAMVLVGGLAAAGCAARQSSAAGPREASCAAPAGEAAQGHLDEGQCLYERGEFESAARAYRHAFAASRVPAILANVAQAYRQAGNCKDAVHYYKRYLEGVPDAADREVVERSIRTLAGSCDALIDSPQVAGTR